MSILDTKLPHSHQETGDALKNNKRRWIIAITISAFIIAIMAGVAGYQFYYNTKFFPGTRIGAVKVGGLTPQQAFTRLSQHLTQLETEGLEIRTENGVTTRITSTLDTGNPDIARQVYSFNPQATIQEAFESTHQSGWVARLLAPLTKRALPIRYELDEDALITSINEKFGPLNKPAINARPTITWTDNQPNIAISPEKSGSIINYELAKQEFKKRLELGIANPIKLVQSIDQPYVTAIQGESLKSQITQLLSTSSPAITYGDKKWQLTPKQLAPLLIFTAPTSIGVDQQLWQTWLEKNVAPEVVIEARDAKIEMSGGKITNVQAHRDGTAIDYVAMTANFNTALANQATSTPLQTITIEPRVTTDTVNNLGIKEIIGIGRSNFKGSPKNRLHNIKTGADRLNGIIIPPGEEFSLITTLGEIDAANGYLPELVTKGNKTIPEYGGGLCQIGTTTFRAAMASGLPILERRNHSYSVTYYLENGLPGVDATIYDPKPDFRFQNDTGHHVLIQTRLQGDDVIFEFWGTNDGRVARRTTPRVWGWVSPPPTKIIETTDLAPGEKKCTESAHKGVSASFDYFVTYANGEEKKQTFSSQYKPWQAVCLVGVEKLSEEKPSEEPTTETPSATSSTTQPTI